MKLTNVKIERYEVDIYYYVDVAITSDGYEAWLHHKNFGTSLYMFGNSSSCVSKERFLGLIEDNLEFYISDYVRDVIDIGDPDDEE